MSTGLTETQLNNRLQKAIADGDTDKINELMNAETDAPAEEPENTEETNTDTQTETEDASPAEDKPETVQENKEEEDPLANIPDNLKPIFEDLRQKLQKTEEKAKNFEYQARSHGGKMGSLQQQVEKLKGELNKVTKPQTESPKPAAALKLDDVPKLKALAEKDPEYAEAIQETLGKSFEQLKSEYDAKFNSLKEEAEEKEVREQISRETELLLHYEPRARDIMTRPEWQQFKAEAPPEVVALAQSRDHRSVLHAFQIFGQYWQATNPSTFTEFAGAPETPAATTVAKTEEAATSKVTEQRKQQLATSTSVKPARLVTKPETEATGEDLFKEMYALANKLSGRTQSN